MGETAISNKIHDQKYLHVHKAKEPSLTQLKVVFRVFSHLAVMAASTYHLGLELFPSGSSPRALISTTWGQPETVSNNKAPLSSKRISFYQRFSCGWHCFSSLGWSWLNFFLSCHSNDFPTKLGVKYISKQKDFCTKLVRNHIPLSLQCYEGNFCNWQLYWYKAKHSLI